MRQRIVSMVAAGMLTLVGTTGVLAQEATPEGATPAATQRPDWLAAWAP
jgi:hypothetical protein